MNFSRYYRNRANIFMVLALASYYIIPAVLGGFYNKAYLEMAFLLYIFYLAAMTDMLYYG